MKKILLFAVILGVTLTAVFACNAASGIFSKQLRGSGKLVTKTIAAPDFNEIDASRAVKVVLTDKVTDKITIEADDNIMEYVVVRADEGQLKVSIDKAIPSISNINVTVVVPVKGNISKLDASSASSITGTSLLAADELEIDASSAANIQVAVKARKCSIDTSSAAKVEAALEVTQCYIDLSSGSKVEVTGTATNCEAELSSGSKLYAEKLIVTNYRIDAGSGAHGSINCTGHLNAKASSGAGISYKGACTADVHRSSGANIHNDN